MNTPWGQSQEVIESGSGIKFVMTAGHGGYLVPHELNKQIPANFRTQYGWYEEDCEWAIVDYFLGRYLDNKDRRELAIQTIKQWYWQEWERHTGEIVSPAESIQKRHHLFNVANANNWCVVKRQRRLEGRSTEGIRGRDSGIGE